MFLQWNAYVFEHSGVAALSSYRHPNESVKQPMGKLCERRLMHVPLLQPQRLRWNLKLLTYIHTSGAAW